MNFPKRKLNGRYLIEKSLALVIFLTLNICSAASLEEKLDLTRIQLLGELRKAKTYRIASRSEIVIPEEKANGGKNKLDQQLMRNKCEEIANELFTDQREVTPLTMSTDWIKGDEVVKAKEILSKSFPMCAKTKKSDDALNSLNDHFLSKAMTLEDQAIPVRGGLLFLSEVTGNKLVQEGSVSFSYLFARIYVGDACPLYKEASEIEISEDADGFRRSALAKIYGDAVLIQLEKPNLNVLGYEPESDSKEKSLFSNKSQRLQMLASWYPRDKPQIDEKILKVLVPSFGRLVKPKTSHPTTKSQSASDFPGCFIYFKD